MPSILLVEDDPNLGQLTQEYLTLKGYPTDRATDGNAGLQQFMANTYDLCILDVMMPKKDGFTLAKELRMANRDVPIIFLTAKSMQDDAIQGLRLGADDYITKPFSMEELLLRIQAILRRYQRTENVPETGIYQIGTFQFDYPRQTLTRNGDGAGQRLTSKESELLKLLAQNLNQPLGRSFALKMVWGDDSYFNARSMDVYITKLRKYLKDDEQVQLVNVHGEGFKLVA
ncbi:two component transcriptional regulator, winged helix family [Fibrella aestuarina BUZ 2]|uniref:Two component transcriptional regulator, winged helix family n=1 Tax=Fibrella aestuarina BUZ 2 TaxID=1166018 RepID=I0KFP9_9BACT|nr:response regulator transcription factor [Fibrella aestuarina]CCH02952.1 two component transcriptional regulator, winged helix family [Fibrella aestuarina BUZ 2]